MAQNYPPTIPAFLPAQLAKILSKYVSIIANDHADEVMFLDLFHILILICSGSGTGDRRLSTL